MPGIRTRRLDVTDFATPVTRVETRQYAGGVRMEVATGTAFEHLAYQANALAFKIAPLPNLPGYEDSSWLTFILPPDEVYVGKLNIPVPLRVFPTPPSLIRQSAEPDPDSLKSLEHIREWQYTYLYEHLDAAQDAIETVIHYNVMPTADGTGGEDAQNSLLVALANFRAVYPQLRPHLENLRDKPGDDTSKAILPVFAKLVADAATAWQSAANAREVMIPSSFSENDTGYYELGTADLDTQNPSVTMELHSVSDPAMLQVDLPGYKLTQTDIQTDKQTNLVKLVKYSYQPKSEEEPPDLTYGVPNIPDFKVSIDNRDIIEQQNAWAEIWVSRNRNLSDDQPTHPAFIYQTPKVRFGNMITPLLVNSREWQIETLSTEPQHTLGEHLEQLFSTLLPEQATRDYDLRISCGYAFALAEGIGDNPDLLVSLPVALGPRFTVAAGEATDQFRGDLKTAIRGWWDENQPATSKGMFVFKLAILSPGSNLPLLQIEDLRLSLENITDLQPISV